jgi:hypothetical protein
MFHRHMQGRVKHSDIAGKRGESEFVWEKEPQNSEEMGKEKEASSAKMGQAGFLHESGR